MTELDLEKFPWHYNHKGMIFGGRVIAFSNDAGGEFYLGIQDKPRTVIGIPEDDLLDLEEQISNMVSDNCKPIILPEISFVSIENKHLIKIKVNRGSNLPYYLKSKGKKEGTYIRVGSTNRVADEEIIAELERQKQNISFDSEIVHGLDRQDLLLDSFKIQYQALTGKDLTESDLIKLDLIRSENGNQYPTNALLLLSDASSRKLLFPMAQIECARFKGTSPGNFIDQKTIGAGLSLQADLAYQFVLRHISEGSVDYSGVYRKDRWEYPIIAIREVIRNAVTHRDYSLTGQDIKIAIFDDKIEITNPGKLLPSINFFDMESRQSDIRNKVIAPIFKKLGIIEKWGNGLKLIVEELKEYPEITFAWKELGNSFRIIFLKSTTPIQQGSKTTTLKTTPITTLKTTFKIIHLLTENPKLSGTELAEAIGNITLDGVKYHLKKLKDQGKIKRIGSSKGGYWEVLD